MNADLFFRMKRGRGDKKACAYFFEKSIVMQAFKYLNEAKTKDPWTLFIEGNLAFRLLVKISFYVYFSIK